MLDLGRPDIDGPALEASLRNVVANCPCNECVETVNRRILDITMQWAAVKVRRASMGSAVCLTGPAEDDRHLNANPCLHNQELVGWCLGS